MRATRRERPPPDERQRVMQTIRLLLAAGMLTCAVFSPAQAESGPCRSDQHSGLICGEGASAARVIDGTISQSKRLALAWRSPGLPMEEPPYGRAIESLLIRLADGAVLSRTEGDYWNIGPMHPHHLEQSVSWSANSRFLVEIVDMRWWTHNLRLYAIGTDDSVRVVDLKAIVEPAVRKHLRRKEANYDFSIFGSANGEPAHVTINDRGLIKARVLMVMAHDDPYEMFDVTFQVVNHKDGALAAREVSIRRSHAKRGDY
jgi:hypothetical protein